MSSIYTLQEVKKKNREWGKNRIRIPIVNENLKYRIYDTGEADLDGRYCVALPSYMDPKNYNVRTKYNLF
ncbi:hypothetical protein CPAV1605_177 [seawater metagenome]|uniref:Uncharacterized protein n=1 Tax=seawater metagenome TaxID=1561972 RepID=A0A5E8CKW8_9ZZZZ